MFVIGDVVLRLFCVVGDGFLLFLLVCGWCNTGVGGDFGVVGLGFGWFLVGWAACVLTSVLGFLDLLVAGWVLCCFAGYWFDALFRWIVARCGFGVVWLLVGLLLVCRWVGCVGDFGFLGFGLFRRDFLGFPWWFDFVWVGVIQGLMMTWGFVW